MGISREELKPGLRSLPVGNYTICYRLIEDGIEVIRFCKECGILMRFFDFELHGYKSTKYEKNTYYHYNGR